MFSRKTNWRAIGTYTRSLAVPLRYQTCKVLGAVPECEKGGALFRSSGQPCLLQERYRRAPNQVCADHFAATLANQRVLALGAAVISELAVDRGNVFVAAYAHDGTLLWHREAYGGTPRKVSPC